MEENLFEEYYNEILSEEDELMVELAVETFNREYLQECLNPLDAIKLLNEDLVKEGLLGSILGGLTGFALGKSVGKIIANVLGVEKGVLYDLLTSRLVGAALGSSIGNKIV